MQHGATEQAGAHQGSLRTYITGFILAVLLTLVSFGLVMGKALSPTATLAVIFIAAVAQILVHLHYFLHLDTSSEQRWNLAAFAFTLLIVVIVVTGSVWIMASLHGRTMDGSAMPSMSSLVVPPLV